MRISRVLECGGWGRTNAPFPGKKVGSSKLDLEVELQTWRRANCSG